MAQAIGLILSLLFSGICLVALFIALEALFPKVTRQTRRAAELMPGRALLVGLVNLLFFGSVALGFLAVSDNSGLQFFVLPALLLILLLGIGLLFGLAGAVTMVGERLFEGRPSWHRSLVAGTILYLASLTPLLGWFILFPYLSSLGLGAFLIGWFRRST